MMEGIFTGRAALVVGGSGGLGAALARRLAGSGARLVVHGGRSAERLDRILAELRAAGADAEGFLMPLSGAADAAGLLDRAGRSSPSGSVDILAVAWGPFRRAALESTSPADWSALVEANLAFPGALVSLALGGMLGRGWGRILLYGGSLTDLPRGFAGTAAYSAAKTGLAVLAKSVARGCPGSGVTCNLVCPGLADTEYLDAAARAYALAKAPGGRLLAPEDLAEAGFQLLANPALNGSVLAADGGLSFQ
jgi:NAD(P)-dependent dehydrogenase (short-subunit alcohol dehydrogenase family)